MQSVNIMEEELLKRNTDCVYFLASPLTCKKGFDCEYRHSEIARLNPRDCWYWLAGNCVNPTCGFRHPPLDAHTQVSSESAALPYQGSAQANKTNVPCYFYFNGFCNKGDRCSFLHGPDENAITGNALKTDALPLDHKKSIENVAAAAPTERHLDPSKMAPKPSKDTGVQLKQEDLQQSAPKTMLQKSVSPEMPVIEFEESDVVKPGSLLLKDGITESRSPTCTDKSSEEQVDEHVEPEERWESSPGFDVLVDNKSEDLDYENDSEYLPVPDEEQMDHFNNYDFEDKVQHGARYLDEEFPHDEDVYDAYEGSDNEFISENVRNPRAHPIDRRLDSKIVQKRRRLSPELSDDEQMAVDLRDYLSKRRVVECNPPNFLSRKSSYSHLIGSSSERRQRYNMGRKLRGRSASNVGKHSIESIGDQGYFSNGTNRRGWLKRWEPRRPIGRSYKEKWLPRWKSVSSEVPRNLIYRERRYAQASTGFTGPKTLAQIKEEKIKTENNGRKMRHSSRTASADFLGPKPLSEILKDKGKLDTVRDGTSSSR